MNRDKFSTLLETLRKLPSEEEIVCPRTQRKLKIVVYESINYLIPINNCSEGVYSNFILSGYKVLTNNIIWDANVNYFHFENGAFLLSNEFGPAKLTIHHNRYLIRSDYFIDGKRFSRSQFEAYQNKIDLMEKVTALD